MQIVESSANATNAINRQTTNKCSNVMFNNQVKYFSAKADEAASAGTPGADKPPTEEELANNREEWGEKYTDEAYKFEKEWKLISEKVTNE
jgi:hypothetical protein